MRIQFVFGLLLQLVGDYFNSGDIGFKFQYMKKMILKWIFRALNIFLSNNRREIQDL